MRKILQEQRIVAQDKNRVFVERADARPQSPRDVEQYYQIAEGKGNAYVEFDASPEELSVRYNWRIRINEFFISGHVELKTRGANGRRNR